MRSIGIDLTDVLYALCHTTFSRRYRAGHWLASVSSDYAVINFNQYHTGLQQYAASPLRVSSPIAVAPRSPDSESSQGRLFTHSDCLRGV